MRKGILYIVTFALLLSHTTLYTKANTNTQILVNIEDAQDLYLINIKNNTLEVKTISNKLYTNISCLNSELSTLKSVDFTNAFPCLVSSIEQSLHTNIDYYISIDIKKVLKALNIRESEYDFKSLKSLTNISKQILDHFKISLITNYNKYINTDLNLKDIYQLYQFFNKEHKNTKYYYLNYYLYNNRYYLFDASFHLKK